MTWFYITYRLAFIALGIVTAITTDTFWLAALGCVCFVLNTVDLSWSCGEEIARARRRPTK